MEAIEYKKMFAVEDRHWWFAGKRALVAALVESELQGTIDGEILDVGCGTGANLKFLRRFGAVCGLDLSSEALKFCAERGLAGAVHQGSANALPFADGRFAAVSALDVLYHRQIEPEKALAEIWRVLKPGGYFIVTDSALPFLAGPHDKAVWARERFTKATLSLLLDQHGFRVRRISYSNFFLFPAVFAVRMAERLHGKSGSSVSNEISPLNFLPQFLLQTEAALIRRGINFPVGSSLLALAEKKSL